MTINLKIAMKIKIKFIGMIAALLAVSFSCSDFLDESPQSQVDASIYYKDRTSAETGLTGCYNKFFDQNTYPNFLITLQVSTDDILQPSGSFFQYKQRSIMKAVDVVPGAWTGFYKDIANINFLLQEVEKIPTPAFGTNAGRKAEILAEGHFLRAAAYYYLATGWGDVPLIKEFPDDINETLIAKSTYAEVMAFVKAEFQLAEAGLPGVISAYSNDPVTNERKGRASKWAAKAYLARLALQEKDYNTALTLSNDIINSGLYPFTPVWKTIFQHPMNASESIFEQQNDLSPGFFGSGLYGWFFGYDFEFGETAFQLFEKPDVIGETQGKDVRFDLSYKPMPSKFAPVRAYADGGIESMNLTVIRLTEILLNKAEVLNELNFAGNKTEVINILNMIRARAEDASWVNEFYPEAPIGTTGIPPLDPDAFTTKDELFKAIQDEKRRDLLWEDVLRWVDLYRWDKDYLKAITGSTSDNHLFWPIPPDEIVRNPKLVQNPAYQ
jgi:hypothetical protein